MDPLATEPDAGPEGDLLEAGPMSAWLAGMNRALRGEQGSDVPCGSCTACCESAQFVHIGADEVDTLAHVPPELLVPAPWMPEGDVLLGHDEHGRCPMLGEHGCTIYDHRPRTCRTYDCRVLAAAGLEPDGKPLIAERVRRWRFDEPTSADRRDGEAVRAAAGFLADRAGELPPSVVPVDVTQRAVLAVAISDLFGAGAPDVAAGVRDPTPAQVTTEVQRRTTRAPEP